MSSRFTPNMLCDLVAQLLPCRVGTIFVDTYGPMLLPFVHPIASGENHVRSRQDLMRGYSLTKTKQDFHVFSELYLVDIAML
jgi:hypothetical protein